MTDAAQPAPQFEPEILPPSTAELALVANTAGNALTPRLPELSPGDPLYETAQAAHQYMEEAKAAATRRAYSSDWRHFAQSCDQNGLASLPATPRQSPSI